MDNSNRLLTRRNLLLGGGAAVLGLLGAGVALYSGEKDPFPQLPTPHILTWSNFQESGADRISHLYLPIDGKVRGHNVLLHGFNEDPRRLIHDHQPEFRIFIDLLLKAGIAVQMPFGSRVSVPDGYSDARSWKANECCGQFDNSNNDHSFLKEVIKATNVFKNSNGIKTSISGYSTGATMAAKLAAEGNAIAFASMCGWLSPQLKNSVPTPAKVPTIAALGTADERVPFSGGEMRIPTNPVIVIPDFTSLCNYFDVAPQNRLAMDGIGHWIPKELMPMFATFIIKQH